MPDEPKKPPPPPNPFLANILRNAKAAPKHGVAAAGLETRVCSKCGAARAEGSDLTVCEYCGGSFKES
ncbi:MAG: hypothetical protein QM723_17085 [Myxococcaceae bacterium]